MATKPDVPPLPELSDRLLTAARALFPGATVRRATPGEVAQARRQASKRANDERLLDVRAVVARTGLSRSTIWRLEHAGKFPSRVQSSTNRVAWRESDVSAWIAMVRRPADRE